jgi:hypothetical protein
MALLTDDQWRDKLLDRYTVDIRLRSASQLVYESAQPLVPVLDRYKDAYIRILEQSRTPWGKLVVDIVAERLKVIGFRSDSGIQDDLWNILQGNRIDSLQKNVYREALALGTSYVSVWGEGDTATVAHESGLSVTHIAAPGDSTSVAGAIKVWHDWATHKMRCEVYLADVVNRYESRDDVKNPSTWLVGGKLSDKEWVLIEQIDNLYGEVSIVPFVTRPTWTGDGRSDLAAVTPVIARIETMTVNTMLAVELGAFRQKWATGIEVPTDDEGNPVEPYKAALDRLWISEDPDAKFGVFQDTDIRPYLQAIEDAIGQLSAVSRIPALYFNQSGLSNPPSASSLEASETGLVNKVRDRQDYYAESWEKIANFVNPAVGDLTVMWNDPRTQSDAQTVDAAVKLDSIGVPWESVMEYLGYKPDEIARMKTMRAADTFNQLLNTPLPQATPLVRETPAQVVEPPVA